MTNVPCTNPAHGVRTHVAGSTAAAECATARSRTGGRLPYVPAAVTRSTATEHRLHEVPARHVRAGQTVRLPDDDVLVDNVTRSDGSVLVTYVGSDDVGDVLVLRPEDVVTVSGDPAVTEYVGQLKVVGGTAVYDLHTLSADDADAFGCPGATHVRVGRNGYVIGSVVPDPRSRGSVTVPGWPTRRGVYSRFEPYSDVPYIADSSDELRYYATTDGLGSQAYDRPAVPRATAADGAVTPGR